MLNIYLIKEFDKRISKKTENIVRSLCMNDLVLKGLKTTKIIVSWDYRNYLYSAIFNFWKI